MTVLAVLTLTVILCERLTFSPMLSGQFYTPLLAWVLLLLMISNLSKVTEPWV
jgi:hypothetical protein